MLLPAEASCQTCEWIVLLGLYCVMIKWQQIFKCSPQVTILGVLLHVTLECRHLGRLCNDTVTADSGAFFSTIPDSANPTSRGRLGITIIRDSSGKEVEWFV